MPKSRVFISDKDKGYSNVVRRVRSFADGITLTAGIQGDEAMVSKEESPGVTNAQAAHWNEFGTSRIPQRSFLRSTYDEGHGKYIRGMQKAVSSQVSAAPGPISLDSINSVGEVFISDVRRAIRSRIRPDNAVSTLERKSSRSTTPLVDHGQMIGSLSSVTIRGKRQDKQ